MEKPFFTVEVFNIGKRGRDLGDKILQKSFVCSIKPFFLLFSSWLFFIHLEKRIFIIWLLHRVAYATDFEVCFPGFESSSGKLLIDVRILTVSHVNSSISHSFLSFCSIFLSHSLFLYSLSEFNLLLSYTAKRKRKEI